MNMPSRELGAAAIVDKDYFDKTRSMVIATRERAKKELKDLGFEFGDSMTNFIFAKHPDKHGKDIFDYLRQNGIIVRRFDLPRISEYLRISIGTDEEMDELIRALREFLKE